MTDYAIRTSDLTRSFGDVNAVDSLNLNIRIGEVFGFLGHNGAGKTTTVRLLNGILKPDTGNIQILGYDPRSQGTAVRSRTGILTETPSLDERLTAEENLKIYAELYSIPPNTVQQRVTDTLAQFGLAERATDKVSEYSKGMKQRLALARAFLHEPELIFLDEPTSGLDPVATKDVHNLIRHVSRDKGRTVFLCTHNLIEAQRLCNRVAVMEHGRIVAMGTPQQLAETMDAELNYTVDIDASQIEATMTVLKRIPTVTSISQDDDLTITVKKREAIPDILATLISENIRVYALTPQQTSLEDIYMTLHQRQEKTSS